jgi:hypothetical protein
MVEHSRCMMVVVEEEAARDHVSARCGLFPGVASTRLHTCITRLVQVGKWVFVHFSEPQFRSVVVVFEAVLPPPRRRPGLDVEALTVHLLRAAVVALVRIEQLCAVMSTMYRLERKRR